MRASEFRIGNYLRDKLTGELLSLIELSENKYGFYVINRAKYPLHDGWEAEPIPLTEEWLLKFHSNDEIEKSVRFPNEITIYDRFLFIWKEAYKYWYVVTSNHKEYLTKIEFVHEYQNFIFALTDTELIIKR